MPEKSTNFNPNSSFSRKKDLSLDAYFNGIRANNRSVLARAITLVESRHPANRSLAEEIIEKCLPYSGNSFRIGITGVPGVGKSTFIESFGEHLIKKDYKLAILAIDPSSEKSRGSILGDKTRMEKLAANEKAFIRPSPASDALGGVARKTRESIILCEAAGYDRIIIETVGVGQSETAVHSMVDFFLLLLLPGAGDELQGIKRGIVEMADMIVINKADGNKEKAANKAKLEYKNALHLFPPNEKNWNVPVELCSSLNGSGLDKIAQVLDDYLSIMKSNSQFEKMRQNQNQFWFKESLNEYLIQDFYQHPRIKIEIEALGKEVLNGIKSPFKAAEELLTIYKRK